MAVVERFHLQDSFRVGLFPKPVSPHQSAPELPADQKPERIPARDPEIRGQHGPEEREFTRRHLPARRDDDEIFGKVQTHPGNHEESEDRDRSVEIEEMLDDVVGGLVHGCILAQPQCRCCIVRMRVSKTI